MSSTPTATVSQEEDTAKTPKPSGRNKAADRSGASSHAASRKATGKKTSATKKAVKKKAATKKTAGKKAVRKKTGVSKAAGKKISSKKAAVRKTAGSKTASRKATSAGKTTSRRGKRSGLAGFAVATDTVSEDAATPAAGGNSGIATDDPRSLSWMAASAVNALNAVKAHQAEKASQVKGGSIAETSGLDEVPDDVPVTDAVATAVVAPGAAAETGELQERSTIEVPDEVAVAAAIEVSPVADELPATASPGAAEETEAADTRRASLMAEKPQTPMIAAEEPVETSMVGASVDSPAAETPREPAEGEGSPETAAEVPQEPVVAGTPGESLLADAPQPPPTLDESGKGAASDSQEQAPVATTPDEVATHEAAEAPRPADAEEVEPRKPPVSMALAAPPPVARQGLPVRMIVVAGALGLAVLLGYRYLDNGDEVSVPVLNLPADGSPITDFSRPVISAVPKTVDAAATTPADDLTATGETHELPATVVVTEPASTDAVMPAEADVAAVAPVTAAATGKAAVPEPGEESSAAPVAGDETPVTGGIADTVPTDAVAADAAQATTGPEPAPQAVESSPAPVPRQPAYGAPGYGYGYYPPNWQQPGYRRPAWQAPPPR
jgi:hypothetical protein